MGNVNNYTFCYSFHGAVYQSQWINVEDVLRNQMKMALFFSPFFRVKIIHDQGFPNFWSNRHLNVLNRPDVWPTVHAPIELQGTCKGSTMSPLKTRMKLSIYRVERGLSGSLRTAFLDFRSHNSSISVINYSNTLILYCDTE